MYSTQVYTLACSSVQLLMQSIQLYMHTFTEKCSQYKLCSYTSIYTPLLHVVASTESVQLLSPSSCSWMDSSWSKGESSIQHISTRIREGDKASCTQLTFTLLHTTLSIQLQISSTYINAYVRIPTHAIPDNATLYALHLQCMLAVRLVLRLAPGPGQPFCHTPPLKGIVLQVYLHSRCKKVTTAFGAISYYRDHQLS